MEGQDVTVTCSGPVNIAVTKYWGKRDEKLLLPVNSSLSATLHQKDLRTVTTVTASKSFKEDKFWLNGKEENLTASPRLQNCLKEMRDRIPHGSRPFLKDWKIHIASKNNFPTAAGLASSASGLATFVYTLAQCFGITEKYEGELSSIARLGSGSACRSVYGGFVKWEMGTKRDGSDSIAVQVAPESHWPEVDILVLVVNAEKKGISSTSGMQTSVKTSELLKYRAEHIVPDRMKQFEKAIKEKDFQTFGELTMKDSNQFHAVCLDTYPPIFYMNDTSRNIVQVLTRYNQASGFIKAAYTFDAGPNAVIYTLKEYVPEILDLVHHYFPFENDEHKGNLSSKITDAVGAATFKAGIQRIIHTTVGPGPQILEEKESLLDKSGNLI
eukprot:TRINITY_DN732_c0_g1_i1.p1 TRINITY_DN732_c0_g1~~TRINITY_DN732_c0_g1_i1.p1  ORF type:complete len:384 (+),score=91.02 TRINITY_DN732_c0_g1_i1:132-1283(+)